MRNHLKVEYVRGDEALQRSLRKEKEVEEVNETGGGRTGKKRIQKDQ